MRENVGRVAVLSLFVVAAIAKAQTTPGINYGTTYDNGDFAVRYVSAAEGKCSANTQCSYNFQVTMPTGYSASDVVLSGFRMQWDGSSEPLSAVHVETLRTAYNTSTGVLSWRIVVELGADAAPTATDFSFNLYATIIVADNTDVKLPRNTRSCTGTSGSACVDSGSITGIAANPLQFRQMFIRGIDVRTSSGVPVDVNRLFWDVSYAGASGGANAVGSTTCGLIGLNGSSATEPLDCETNLVAFVSNTANAAISASQVANGGPYNGWSYGSGSEPAPAGAIGGFIALKTLDLDFASNSNVHTFGGGCFAQDWLVATPTYLTFQRYFELTEDTTAPWASFNIDLWCYAGFVP